MKSPSRRLGAGLLGLGLLAPALAIAGASPASAADPVDIQLLTTNDFHGRILQDGTMAGAAVLSGAVKQFRGANPNTIFAAAGDLIGASTFESFISNDKPTIDILNEAGLDVSATGNHEFDQGFDDLKNRVMAPYDATTNPDGGANWAYIASNVKVKATGDPAVPATWTQEMDGVKVGFVGAVTEDLPSLVSPAGIADLEVDGIVDSVNTYADELKADGADVVVMLVHEGAPSTDCATMGTAGTTWGDIVNGVDANVDAIVSGHTHLAYDCEIDGRPVVSAGQYGTNLNKLNFSVDPDTGDLLGIEHEIVPLMGPDPDGGGPLKPPALFPSDPAVEAIVTAAKTQADVLGAKPLGKLQQGFQRARLANDTENRGGESTLGNLVAEVQRWATESETTGSAQIAFMNPGGLRQDMVGGIDGETAYPKTLTYKQAAVVQPFANTLVNMDLTGAQIRTVLEQQWQRDKDGNVPTRAFLRLGVSEGFRYTYDETPVTVGETETFKGEITGMWLNGEPIKDDQTYSVTANSFLASGGDNFFELAKGANPRDTGQADLAAMVDYMAEHAADQPLPVDYAQRAVEVSFPDDAPASYQAGDTVSFDLASLSMSGPGDMQPGEVTVSVGTNELGTFPVDSTPVSTLSDTTGTASVSVTLPAGLDAGTRDLLVSDPTGTSVQVPITVKKQASSVKVTKVAPSKIVAKKTKAKVTVKVKAGDEAAKGKVTVTVGGKTYTKKLSNGKAKITLKVFTKPGKYKVKVKYLGNDNTSSSSTTTKIKVVKKR